MCVFSERRLSMNDDIMDSISIEKFAAYLDNNLPPSEMHQISSMVENEGMLHDLLKASQLTEETFLNYSDDDLALPEEIASNDFDLPILPEAFTEALDTCDVACASAVDSIDWDVPIEEAVKFDDPLTNDLLDNGLFLNDLTNEDSITPENDGEIWPDNNDY